MAAATQSRQRIIEGALRCFDRRGVLATTVDDVRRETGASVGSIYHHFADKEGLAAAVYVDGLAGYQEAFLSELDRHAGAEGGVRAIVAFHLRWCAANPTMARFLLARPDRSARLDAVLRAINRRFFAGVLAWWKPHAASGALRDLPVDLVQALWLGPAQELCRHWLAHRTRTSPRRASDLLAEAAWLSLKTPEGAS